MTSSLIRTLAGLAVAGLLLTGCGSDADSNEETSTGSAASSAPATSEAPAAEAAPTGDQTAAVTAAYQAYFGKFDPAALEDAESFGPDLEAAKERGQAAGNIGVNIKKVTPATDSECEAGGATAPCAKVLFDLTINGTPVVPDQNGFAVYQDGRWKVAKTTFCALSAAGSNPPKACNS